jgi:hypothetical protein
MHQSFHRQWALEQELKYTEPNLNTEGQNKEPISGK